MSSPPALVFDAVGLVAGDRRVLDEVSFTLAAGEALAIVGESGSGKSTLARVAVGLVLPTAGRVTLLGEDIVQGDAAVRPRIGMALQGGSLIGALTVEENLKLGLGPGNAAGWTANLARVDRLLYEFGIDELADARVEALPTGAKRQLEVVRALLRDPALLILDEPFEGAAAHGRHLAEAVRRSVRRRGGALLVLTQDEALAALLAPRRLTLQRGRLQQSELRSPPPAASAATAVATAATLS